MGEARTASSVDFNNACDPPYLSFRPFFNLQT
jgi:hypothetical protein